jgi:hypothetical protein
MAEMQADVRHDIVEVRERNYQRLYPITSPEMLYC